MKLLKKILSAVGVLALACSTAFASVAINAANFPDATFRSYVSSNFDKNSDGTLSDAEIANIKQIDVSNSGVANLIGIENFTALEKLSCSGNDLKGVQFPNQLPDPMDSSRNYNFYGIAPLYLFKQFKQLNCDFGCHYENPFTKKGVFFSCLDFTFLYGIDGTFDNSYLLMVWFDTNGRRGLVTPQIDYATDTVTGARIAIDMVGFPTTVGDPVMLEFRTTGNQSISVRMIPILP